MRMKVIIFILSLMFTSMSSIFADPPVKTKVQLRQHLYEQDVLDAARQEGKLVVLDFLLDTIYIV